MQVKLNILSQSSEEFNMLKAQLESNAEDLNRIIAEYRDLTSFSRYTNQINRVKKEIYEEAAHCSQFKTALESIRNLCEATENRIVDRCEGVRAVSMETEIGVEDLNGLSAAVSNIMKLETEPIEIIEGLTADEFWSGFWSNYGWEGLLSGAGYIGTIYDLISDIKNGKTWKDFGKTGISIYQFLSGAVKTFNNYKKIGNAVGTETAMAWWLKNITGLKPLGRASTAKNPFTRFANNLTNKTSPFNAQFKNVVNNFKGANGIGKAVASWGAVAVNGVLNWFSNKDEQASSNGTMSDGRVIAETITETAVDTVLTYGTGIVVGAAVTAVAGTVAAPGVVVVAASGAVVAGLNAGVKALTGKTTTEWISDTILDTGVAIGNAVKNASKSIGSWFGKLLFT